MKPSNVLPGCLFVARVYHIGSRTTCRGMSGMVGVTWRLDYVTQWWSDGGRRRRLDEDPSKISARNILATTPPEPDQEGEVLEIPRGSAGGTALSYAVKAGLSGIVKLLINRGADVNASATVPQGWAPLHDATYYTIRRDLRDGLAIIRLLVAAGADVNAETCGGRRPLDIAAYLSFDERSCDVFDLLAELGCRA